MRIEENDTVSHNGLVYGADTTFQKNLFLVVNETNLF